MRKPAIILFHFIKTNPRGAKPRTAGITEIRGQYYSVIEKLMFEAAEPAVFECTSKTMATT